MNYSTKLKCDRFSLSSIKGRTFNEEMESDRGRAINSAAVRRLQQKTQVFPLETNAAVRSRLTHSLEVQQVGRYIIKLIIKQLKKNGALELYGILGNEEGVISSVEMACLLHDIGNPPFGHFGEEAICKWSREFLQTLFEGRFKGCKGLEKIVNDLCNFEGNAQALRVLHSLQSLNLTFTQLASMIKYTRPAYEKKPKQGDRFQYRKKKPGYYLTEEKLVEKLIKQLAIPKGNRFPLTYVMEAADDISYCIADVDDAVEKGILTVSELNRQIISIWSRHKKKRGTNNLGDYLIDIAKKAYKKYESAECNKSHAYILTLRTTLVNDLSKYVAGKYIEHHNKIFKGELDQPLLSGDDKYHLATETLREIAVKNVFNNKEVENLELKGYAVVSGLLKLYSPLLELNYENFCELVKENSLKTKPIETRLYHKLPAKHIDSYLSSISNITKVKVTPNEKLMELYFRTRLLLDYISGMTDHFALDEFKSLTARI